MMIRKSHSGLLVAVLLAGCDSAGSNSPDALANKLASAIAYSSYCGSDKYTQVALMAVASSPYSRDFEERGKYAYKITARILALRNEAEHTPANALCAKLGSAFQ